MKKPKPTKYGLVFIFTLAIFLTLLITISIFGAVMIFFEVKGILNNSHFALRIFPIVVSAAATLVLGTMFSSFAVRILLKPIGKLINSMNLLAEGHFEARLDTKGLLLGEMPLYQKLSDTFNKLADELQSTEILRSDFVNNFSHEFKTPIVSIKGFAKILQYGDLPDEEQQEYLDIIVEESTRLSNMATSVLNLTKIENQNILTNTERYDLSEQIRKCIVMLEKKWSAKCLEMIADFPEYTVNRNMQLLNQVWINLLDNAVKFSPEDGTVRVNIVQTDQEIKVSIWNHGPEIPQEQMKRLYDKFWQGDTSHASEGTGIGLSIVKKIVELHRGKIEVASSPDETAFTVILPQEN